MLTGAIRDRIQRSKQMAENITIAEAVEQLRVQLAAAQAQRAKVQREGGTGKDLRFLTKSVEVELAVVFKTEVEGGVGLKAWFLEASGKTKGSDEATHKVKLVLEPVGPGNTPTQISDTEHESDRKRQGGH
jgi:hypothetical protein